MSTVTPVDPAPTFAELLRARAEDDAVALAFEDQEWTWREAIVEARRRHALLRTMHPGDEPLHIGLFLENSPDHVFWYLAAALHGVTAVGLNPTRRGADLARDIAFTDCALVVVDEGRRPLLEGIEGLPPVLDVDGEEYAVRLAAVDPAGVAQPEVAGDAILSLLFTSGTTSAPKAVICTQARMGRIALQQRERRNLTPYDTFYVVMPLFHGNALMAGLAPAVAAGAKVVVRRRFSASAWLDEVRRHGVTFFNYVGKPLNYILATPERPDDADNPLRIAFGNEATDADIAKFSARFGCTVVDSFGSTEGEIQIIRTPDTPPGSLGLPRGRVVVMDPETLVECPPAQFDAQGRITNADEATGEMVHLDGPTLFEGYWRNPEASEKRLRNGWSWSGDLAYRDEAGFFYFAGRNEDWLRVDGENLAAAPIERVLHRHEAFSSVSVVATPDPVVGDQVLAVVELAAGASFDASAFVDFLDAQSDLGTKWTPAFVKVVDALPRTPTNKVLKRQIDREVESGTPGLWARAGGTYLPA